MTKLREILIWLNSIPGLAGVRTRAVLDFFGDAESIVRAGKNDFLQVPGIGEKIASEICSSEIDAFLDRELEAAERNNITVLTLEDEGYPKQLKAIYDPPHVLYLRGELKPVDALSIGVVGSRRCSVYGKSQSEKLSGGLARAGMTVVSGCALGIDAAAHRGALQAGGRTLGVIGSGLLKPYPKDNIPLMKDIVGAGAVISEFHLNQGVERGNFVRRNRVISGLSLGVLVVEAAKKSGSLITAHHALGQGREVFAVPGSIDSPRSKGTHSLIKQGAKLVESAQDILEEFAEVEGLLSEPDDKPASTAEPSGINREESLIMENIEFEPVQIDTIISGTGLPAGKVAGTLVMLEMKNLIRELPGKQYVRVQ